MFYVRGKIPVSKYNEQLQALVKLLRRKRTSPRHSDLPTDQLQHRQQELHSCASVGSLLYFYRRSGTSSRQPSTAATGRTTSASHGTVSSAIWSVNHTRHSGCSSKASVVLLQYARNRLPVKREKRSTVELQCQHYKICCDRRDVVKCIAATLRSVGNKIHHSFKCFDDIFQTI